MRFQEGSQSFVVIKASTVFESREAQNSYITLPPVLNIASDATIVAGMARMWQAIFDWVGSLSLFTFH